MKNFLPKLLSWTEKPRNVIGIMTGTSLDGIDCALCRIETIDNRISMELLHYSCDVYPKNIKELIQKILSTDCPISDYGYLNYELSRMYASTIITVCNTLGVDKNDIDLVCIHGQTLWHDPINRHFSLQAGNGEVLAKMIGIPVVSDFRSGDVALGGNGAPLVPVFDAYYVRHKTDKNVLLNIGGMANITVVPPIDSTESIIAFDTGPGNVLIDSMMMHFYGKKYDDNGITASSGTLNNELFSDLSSLPFFQSTPPKSTGREIFGSSLVQTIVNKHTHASPQDIVRTLTEITAWSIADHIVRYASDTNTVYCSGGGSHNKTLMDMLREKLPTMLITTTAEIGIDTDAKEAMCFAFMGYRSLAGLPSNIPSVTGASREAILGSLSLP